MKTIAFITILLIFALAPDAAFACACCADRGDYYLSTVRTTKTELELLNELNFNGVPEMATSAGGYEDEKGLDSVIKDLSENYVEDYFGVAPKLVNRVWNFNFTTKTGKKGTLSLPLPSTMVSFGADIHDTPAGQETILYKEWRFKGNVRGTGFFAAGLSKPATYFLVLQGRGNHCSAAQDFSHWRLEVTGPRADYAFFGSFK